MSWRAVSGSDITYTVVYAEVNDRTSGERVEGIIGTSTILGPLSPGTTYSIWVAAVSSGGVGNYNSEILQRTYQCEQTQTCIVKMCNGNHDIIGIHGGPQTSGPGALCV